MVVILLGNVARFLFCRKQLGLSAKQYGKNVLFPIVAVTTLSVIGSLPIHISMSEGWGRLFLTTLISCVTISILVYAIGLTTSERTFIVSWVKLRIKQSIH